LLNDFNKIAVKLVMTKPLSSMKSAPYLILISGLLVAACKSGPKRFADNPGDIIGKDKMVAVLTDITLAEGALNVKSFPKDSSNQMASGYYPEILAIHDVKSDQFRKSFRYYSENPDVMVDLQKKVIESLSAREGRNWHKEGKDPE